MTEPMLAAFDLAAAILALLGSLVFLGSAIGLLLLPDFATRIHAPTKAATLGVALLATASLVRSLPRGDMVWIEDLAIVVFLFLTVPVSSQMLLRASRAADMRREGEPGDEDVEGPRRA